MTERTLEVSLVGALEFARTRARQQPALGQPVPALRCERTDDTYLSLCDALEARMVMGPDLPYCERCGWTMTVERLEELAAAARAERAEPAQTGHGLAPEPLVFIGWIRFASADALYEGARHLEQLMGRDPDKVRHPHESRRLFALGWPLEDLRGIRLPDDYASDAALIESEGGAWALCYGLGTTYLGALALKIRELGVDCEVAGVRVQAADARFPATTESAVEGREEGDPAMFTDGTPDAAQGPALAEGDPKFVAVISSPQAGLAQVHHLEGQTAAELLRRAADDYDFTQAESIDVAIRPVPAYRVIDESNPDNDCGAQG